MSEIVYFNLNNKNRKLLNSEFNINNNLTIITTCNKKYIVEILKKCNKNDEVILDGVTNLPLFFLIKIYFYLKTNKIKTNSFFIC